MMIHESFHSSKAEAGRATFFVSCVDTTTQSERNGKAREGIGVGFEEPEGTA